MTETRITLAMSAADAKHMVRVLTKAAAGLTLHQVKAQFVSNTVGVVTLHTEASDTGSGYGTTYVTQEYPKVAANTLGATVAAPAAAVKKTIRFALKNTPKGEEVNVTLPAAAAGRTLGYHAGADHAHPEFSVAISSEDVRTLDKSNRFLRGQQTGFEVVAIAYTLGCEVADVYSMNRRVVAHHQVPVVKPAALGEQHQGEPSVGSGDVLLPVPYDVWDVYTSAQRGPSHTVVEHTGDGGHIILSGGGTVVRYVSLGEDANGQMVRKYLRKLHEDNKGGSSANHHKLPSVRFDRKKLLKELKTLVQSVAGKPGSKNLDSNTCIRSNGSGGITLAVRNWANLQTDEADSQAVRDASEQVLWEPTTHYYTNPENKEQLEEADRQPVTYNTRSLLHVLTMTDDEFVTLMPPKYFSDTMVVFLSNNPGSDLVHGSWVFLPCTMMELSQRREQKIRDNTTEDKKQRPQTTFNPQIDRTSDAQ